MNGEQMVLICNHVLARQRPIALAVHHADGMLQILCGEVDHATEDDVEVVHLEHVWDMQPELKAIIEALPKGYLAERENGRWMTVAHDD